MIRYTPNLGSTIWNNKSQQIFNDAEELKTFIAEKATSFKQYVGKNVIYHPDDVALHEGRIALDGMFVGYCVEN